VSAGAGEEEVAAMAAAEPGVAQHVAGKRLVKRVYVPNKLLNLVVA
jgi:leucyl-tRNA synthetase